MIIWNICMMIASFCFFAFWFRQFVIVVKNKTYDKLNFQIGFWCGFWFLSSALWIMKITFDWVL